ncbi:hypothetical protein, partial [Pseudomonas aeruginosa]|uniref:hypothetical protein n=1 Tax=Pseudomonas aeruginosa TaxID=287 RepID=UPI0031B68A6D
MMTLTCPQAEGTSSTKQVAAGTGTPTGSAEPSPKPTFISQILPTLSQYFNHSKGSIFNADWL